MNPYFKKKWMLFGIAMAKMFPFLHRAKMAVGDSMVLSCTLTMPTMPNGNPWPDRKPLLVMFRAPKKHSGGGELWVAAGDNPDRSQFTKLDIQPMPLFGGKAYVFVTDNFDQRLWYIVKCDDVEADPVLSKIDVAPSGFSMEFVKADLNAPATFDWPPAPNDNHWIHFLVVSQGDELLTGIYTSRTSWLYGQFGDLPYYIHDPMNTPEMMAGQEYNIMYHAVDLEGWVSMSCMRNFSTTGSKESTPN